MINLDKVSYRYPGSNAAALTDITAAFSDGSFTAVMGANGSGKSTLARCLNGLLVPTSGTVTVDDLRTNHHHDVPLVRRKVGLVFQDPNLQMTSATIERELAFGLQNVGKSFEEIRTAVEHELCQLELTAKRHHPPAMLSGGEKVRLTLAAVLLLEPRHLVLDEPTSFLSRTSRQRLLDTCCSLRDTKNTTLILVTQFPVEAMRADRLMVLEKSRVVFDGLPGNVLHNARQLDSWGIATGTSYAAAT